MSRRTPEEIAYDAIVYWRDRFHNELVDLSLDKHLPVSLRQTVMLYVQAVLDRLNDQIAEREQELDTRP